MNERQKVLISGDTARGKTSLANRLSKHFPVPILHLDSVLWEKRLIKARPLKEREEMVSKFLSVNEKGWIIEGAQTHLIKLVVDRADVIVHLKYNSFVIQIVNTLNRELRDGTPIREILQLLAHLFKKRLKQGNKRETKLDQLLASYQEKVVVGRSYKEIDSIFKRLVGEYRA